MNIITTKLNSNQVVFGFNVLNNPLNYNKYNSGVLKIFSEQYNPQLYQEFILPILQEIYTENKSHFKEYIPVFTKAIAPGMGLAERPNFNIKFQYIIDSEVNYCEFIAHALMEAHLNNDESPEARIKYVIKHFENIGIDLDCPYLNPGSEDIYTPLDID